MPYIGTFMSTLQFMNNIEKSSVRFMLFSASYIVECYSLANAHPSTEYSVP